MGRNILLLWVLYLLASGSTTADNHPSCFDDVDACTHSLRSLMVDEDKFWFGKDFVRSCPPGSMSTGCTNADTDGWSILARVYNVSDDTQLQKYAQANSNLTLADVTYPEKKGQYFGCGHIFEAHERRYRLDPMKVTTVNSWTLDNTPMITWDGGEGDDTLYTVVVWDVGYFYLHGLYINAKGGNMDSAMPIDYYHGPINPLTRPNVYLFGIFKQNMYINPGMAYGVMGKAMGLYQGAVPMSTFLSDMGGSISDMVAANVMSVIGDAYSMERQKNRNIINSCPHLITQSPALKDILKDTNMKASWSKETETLDYTEPSYLSSLTADLFIEYSMPNDLTVDSCCVKTTFTQSLYRPDPLGTHVARPALTKTTPRVKISPIYIMSDFSNSIRTKIYTLMMVDMTDPSSPILHWMVSNILNADVGKGEEVLPYLGPNPFKSNEPRTYVFLLLKQNVDRLDTQSLSTFTGDSCPYFLRNRCGVQLSRMLEAWNLEEIVGITWFQAVQDAYARKRLYNELMVKTMTDVCEGQPGFEDPCPEDHNGGNGHPLTASIFCCIVTALTTLYYNLSTMSI